MWYDLQPNNLLMGIDDKSVLAEYEKDELAYPVPREINKTDNPTLKQFANQDSHRVWAQANLDIGAVPDKEVVEK
ncbi:hypothetical protein EMCG_07673 [[Emmonsia] crescens]|uniref:Protein kinase domain-containing protein n=1 Tax=[Emmonsia] crescens TaxID=73230 RepID=A0A0G2J599_9EURO|nr:hypothetical protein EMCG_07673 [Emmonsia crescens UAMH 3008]